MVVVEEEEVEVMEVGEEEDRPVIVPMVWG